MVPFLKQLLIRPHHFSGRSGEGGETRLTAVEGKRLTAVEGKRSTAMVVLDDGGPRPAAVLYDDGGGDEQRQRWRRMECQAV
jgi:hypothetical protein